MPATLARTVGVSLMSTVSVSSNQSVPAGRSTVDSTPCTSSMRAGSASWRAERFTRTTIGRSGNWECQRAASMASAAQHAPAQLDDQAGLLGDRHERCRGDEAVPRSIPPHERLDADDLATAEVDLGLVVHLQLVVRERASQRRLGVETMSDALPELVVVELASVAPAFLGEVHGRVGP